MKDKIFELIGKMTFEEKVTMVVGSATMDSGYVERLDIKPFIMADGPHGVRFRANPQEKDCTSLPSLSALGATWNREIAYQYGECIAKDCIHHDKDMILGPGVNIKRIDLCGRNFEYFSEDPYHTGVMAAEYIKGVQDKGVGACIKHFAVNNQEVDRLHISSEIDERTIREIYLKAFEIAIEKSDPAAVMTAVNKVNSVLCSENKLLLNDILKEQWKYKGLVMSDWGCSKNAVKSLLAGLDLRMPDAEVHMEDFVQAIERGEHTKEEIEKALDEAVARILRFMLNLKKDTIEYNRDQQHKTAQKVAEESIVLLKNEDNILPITKEKYKKITIIGEFAEEPVIYGYGSSMVVPKEERVESPLDFIRELCDDDIEVTYVPLYPHDGVFLGGTIMKKRREYAGIEQSDLVILFAGRPESVETEGTDRVTSHLEYFYEFFIKRIYPLNPNIVLVSQTGGAFMDVMWRHKVKGIVQMWLSGEGGGSAIANVLFGKVNPSGKLSETFPNKTRTDIDYPGDGYKVCYDEKWRVGYRYYDLHPEEVWFPFGHGLSYTQFEYSNMKADRTDAGFAVSVDIQNTGGCDGAEVAQLYFSDVVSTVSRPKKELCGFEKVFIKAGETKTVTFHVTLKDLSYYNVILQEWVAETGNYVFSVGASSQDIRLSKKVFLDEPVAYTLQYNAEQIMG